MKPEVQDSLGRRAQLAEYTALRAEAASLTQGEISTAAATFSFIATILGVNFFLGGTNVPATKFVILGICPLVAMFFGVLWLNAFYRRARIGSYLFLAENDINREIPEEHQKVYWEHWILTQSAGRNLFTKVDQFYGYVAFGSWLLSPIIVLFCAHFLFPEWELLAPKWNLLKPFCTHPFLVAFLVTVTIIYAWVMIIMCREILNLKNMDKLQLQERTAGHPPVQGETESKPKKSRCIRCRSKCIRCRKRYIRCRKSNDMISKQ